MEGIISLLIPIFAVLGLFASIIIAIIMKAKRTRDLYDKAPAETIAEIVRNEAETAAIRRRRSAILWAGAITGLGLGLLVAFLIIHFASVSGDSEMLAMWFGLPLLFTGLGLLSGYFLDRKLESK